ncbi:MAG: hypothetical protein ABRQ26_16425, partial [Syntrophomonadaceae bacterium]
MKSISRTDDEIKFLVVNKESDWDLKNCVNVEYVNQEIRLAEIAEYEVSGMAGMDRLTASPDLVDWAAGPGGQVFCIFRQNDGSATFNYYDCIKDRFKDLEFDRELFSDPAALAVSRHNYYICNHPVNGYTDPEINQRRIVALAEIDWQIRWIITSLSDASGHDLDDVIKGFIPL